MIMFCFSIAIEKDLPFDPRDQVSNTLAREILRQLYGRDLADIDSDRAIAALKFFDLQNPEEFGIIGVMEICNIIKIRKGDTWSIRQTDFLMKATSLRLQFLM